MSIATDKYFRRALQRYADAVAEKAFEGTIPYFSDDPEEQRALDAAHKYINDELAHSKHLLTTLMDRRIAATAKPVGEVENEDTPLRGHLGRILTDEQVHAIEDAAAKRALEYATRRVDDLVRTTTNVFAEDIPTVLLAMTDGVWRFRADSQGKEPEA